MSLEAALGRWERLLGDRFLEQLATMSPGLDDDGIGSLRAALAPHALPAQVETLYRWRNGGSCGLLGSWRLRPVDELLSWREFCLGELAEPPAWLQLFDDQMLGFVTLDVAGQPPADPSVWYGHTHDAWVSRLFDSIEALVDVCCVVAEQGRLAPSRNDTCLTLDGDPTSSLDGNEWLPWRLERCPTSFQWPDPPPGTYLARSPEPTWPMDWLASLGVTDDWMRSRRATTTVAELAAAAAAGEHAVGTIVGRVVTGAGMGDYWIPEVEDGTGRIRVVCNQRELVFSAAVHSVAEFDVVLDPHLQQEPGPGSLPVAKATAVRPQPKG